MEDFGSEEHLGGHHWVFIGKEEFRAEEATLVGSLPWARNLHEEVAWVVIAGLSIDADD